MKMNWWNAFVVGGSLFVATQSALANEKLADVMNLLLEQQGGIAATSKLVPAAVDEKTFKRTLSRARVAQWLLAVANERKGKLEGTKLTAEELTPDKLTKEPEATVEALHKQYGDLLMVAQAKFKDAETELVAQAALEPAKRDFEKLKTAVQQISAAMIAGHRAIK